MTAPGRSTVNDAPLWLFDRAAFDLRGVELPPVIEGNAIPHGTEILCKPAALTDRECDAIVEIAHGLEFLKDYPRNGRIDLRNSRSVSLPMTTDTRWLYRRVEELFAVANRVNRFALYGIDEPLQLIEYKVHGFVDWHTDVAWAGPRLRKTAMSIQLSAPEDYRGGGLEFLDAGGEMLGSRKRGSVITFPAFSPHRVTRISRGRRLSLVALATGPRFQ